MVIFRKQEGVAHLFLTASYPCEWKNQVVFLFAAACSKRSICAINGVHVIFFRLFNHVADADGTVEHGILRVDVQVGEGGHVKEDMD